VPTLTPARRICVAPLEPTRLLAPHSLLLTAGCFQDRPVPRAQSEPGELRQLAEHRVHGIAGRQERTASHAPHPEQAVPAEGTDGRCRTQICTTVCRFTPVAQHRVLRVSRRSSSSAPPAAMATTGPLERFRRVLPPNGLGGTTVAGLAGRGHGGTLRGCGRDGTRCGPVAAVTCGRAAASLRNGGGYLRVTKGYGPCRRSLRAIANVHTQGYS